jgi:ribosomal protein L9
MKVILTKDIKGFGAEVEITEVRSGFAINYLFPNCMAVEAPTTSDIEQVTSEIKEVAYV